MSCERFEPLLIGHLYDEIEPAQRDALAAHLSGCERCRRALDELAGTRARIQDAHLDVPRAPRLLVLSARPRLRPALAFAAGVACALLLGAAAGIGGYALAKNRPDEDAIRREVDRRFSAIEADLRSRAEAATPAAASVPAATPSTPRSAVTREQLESALSRFERRINASRASDIDYVLNQIAASEQRTGFRIGETRQALRYVALASNPALMEK